MVVLSVVIETVNATPESHVQLRDVLGRLREQTIPEAEIERIVVIEESADDLAEAVRQMDPAARVIRTPDSSYYGMKRHGMRAARGEVIALLDSDCMPVKDWAEHLLTAIERGADVVAGKVRFPRGSAFARTFALFDYGHIRNEADGLSRTFNVSNAGLRGDVIRRHSFDDRLTRFGGGAMLGRHLRSLGYKIKYDPAVSVVHNDKGVKKHLIVRFRTGHEAVRLGRFDEAGALADSKYLRLGIAAPFVIAARRMLFDWRMILENRRDLEIAWYEVPYFAVASVLMRTIEATGGVVTTIWPNFLAARYGW